MVLVTHDLGLVEAESDRVAILYAGMTVEHGPTARVIADPAHPYTRALLGALPARHARRQRLTAIPGRPPEPRAWPTGCRFAPRCPHALARCSAGEPLLTVHDADRTDRCIRSKELRATEVVR
jgi:oligopeptide/dipeptide ABC transporter ATP-binding protein